MTPEIEARLRQDVEMCRFVTTAVHYHGSDKDQLASDIEAALQHIADLRKSLPSSDRARGPDLVGLTLTLRISRGPQLRAVVSSLCKCRALRCLSPHRDALCDAPATSVLWQDLQEWYPCCDRHRDEGTQWAGSTEFSAGDVDFEVIPAEAFAWLRAMLPEDRRSLRPRCEIYEREP